tara:strand:- start:881 stop:1222 length:342 start_codon:yes stop_codon:yes gene_type:complete
MEEDTAVRYIEKNYPQTARAFKAFQHEQYLLFCKKQKDYGSSNITLGGDMENEDDMKFALHGLLIRMNDKMNRMMNLVRKQLTPENEPLEDAFQDISVYGIIARIVKDGSWGK